MAEEDISYTICENGTQLYYVGQESEQIPCFLSGAAAAKIKRVDLSFNQITDLSGISQFPNVEELILDNNEISDDIEVPRMPNLHTLTLNKNKIENLDRLLNKLEYSVPAITYLSLIGNGACPSHLTISDSEDDYKRYRLYVLYHLPKLKFLDSTPVRNSERDDAAKRGSLLRVARPQTQSNKGDTSREDSYTPLPNAAIDKNSNQALYGKCKYVYYGKHSEGNRFIRNNDL